MKTHITIRDGLLALMLVVGMTRMMGYVVGSRLLQGIGAASGIAPFTKVFCSVDGYEAFTAQYWLCGARADGSTEKLELTRERYARLHGPYMRRNAFGAALVFAPRLPEALRSALHAEALRPQSVMWRELEVPDEWVSLAILIRDLEGNEWCFTTPAAL